MQIPRSPADITPAWLTAALRDSGAVEYGAVETVTVTPIGEGQGLGGGIYRVAVTYGHRENAGPTTMVAKLAPEDDEKRRIMNGLGLFEREHRFYREIPISSGVRMPHCHYSGFDPASGCFVLLLEDLGHLRGVDQADECSLEDAQTAIRALVEMHSKWWNSNELDRLPWLIDPGDRQIVAHLQERYSRNIEPFVEIAGEYLPPGVEAVVRGTGPNFASAMVGTGHGPVTLNHGDYRLGNLFFDDADGSAGPVVAFDWPSVCRRRAPGDLSYFLGGCFRTAKRRQHERQLLSEYHEGLVDHGISGYSYDEFLTDFRVGLFRSLTNFVPGIVEMGTRVMSSEQGRERVAAMCERFETLVDWDCLGAISK